MTKIIVNQKSRPGWKGLKILVGEKQGREYMETVAKLAIPP